MEKEGIERIKDLFHLLLENEKETEIMDLIIDGKEPNEIVKILIKNIEEI